MCMENTPKEARRRLDWPPINPELKVKIEVESGGRGPLLFNGYEEKSHMKRVH